MTDILVNGRVLTIPPGFRVKITLEQLPELAAIAPDPSELLADEEHRLESQRRMLEGARRGAAMATAKRNGLVAAADVDRPPPAKRFGSQAGRKTCPECREKSPPRLQECVCGYRWPPPMRPSTVGS